MVLENVKILLCIFTWMSKYLEHLISQCHNFDQIKLNQISDFEYICLFSINYTSTKSWKSWIFIAVCLYVYVCLCVSVCVCVCVCVSVCQWKNFEQKNAPIWTRFSLNGCIPHWLGPYSNMRQWVKGQGYSDGILFFFFIIPC